MSNFSEYIGNQFGNPRGIVGKICCLIMNKINKKMYQAVVRQIADEKSILDIGYGNGYLIEQIYKKTNAKISGIDISNDMKIAASKRNSTGIEKGDIKLSIGDCCDLKSEDNMFDAVTTVNTIYFWSDTVKGLKEIQRVLKDRGTFYNAVYSKEWLETLSYTRQGFKLFEKDEYVKSGKEAGFSEVTVTPIIPGKSFLIIYKK